MKFYKFRQNNSGGSFYVNDEVTIEVFIEAENADMANTKAQTHGIYFNGCSTGSDCDCCGDRWYKVSERNACDNPIEDASGSIHWVDEGECYTRIYFNNGTKEEWTA